MDSWRPTRSFYSATKQEMQTNPLPGQSCFTFSSFSQWIWRVLTFPRCAYLLLMCPFTAHVIVGKRANCVYWPWMSKDTRLGGGQKEGSIHPHKFLSTVNYWRDGVALLAFVKYPPTKGLVIACLRTSRKGECFTRTRAATPRELIRGRFVGRPTTNIHAPNPRLPSDCQHKTLLGRISVISCGVSLTWSNQSTVREMTRNASDPWQPHKNKNCDVFIYLFIFNNEWGETQSPLLCFVENIQVL